MDGNLPPADGPVAIYDDDHAYIAGVIAEKLSAAGHQVVFVTPETVVSSFTKLTLEQERIQTRLIELNVDIRCARSLRALDAGRMQIACTYTGREEFFTCHSAVLVTERHRETALFDALRGNASLETLELLGDAASPGLIVDAVYHGHMAARNFGRDPQEIEADWYRRELPDITDLKETARA